MLLVGLNLLAIFNTAMHLVVDVFAGDDRTWADCVGNPVLMRKGIEPEDAQKDHLDDHLWWVARERRGVVTATTPFLDGADATFDFGNVLVFAGSIQGGVEVPVRL
jgi:hypothetical protein